MNPLSLGMLVAATVLLIGSIPLPLPNITALIGATLIPAALLIDWGLRLKKKANRS